VLLNKGDGTFAPMTSYPAGFSPMGVAIGDLNGDGRGDIAVANEVGGSVTILLSSP